MMGKCTMCGKCCEAITLNASKHEVRKARKSQTGANRDTCELIIKSWKRISQKQAYRINPYMKIVDARLKVKDWKHAPFYYSCQNYDKETRMCKIHDHRPPICSGYPWYGGNPSVTEELYSEDCGYKIDREIFRIIKLLKDRASFLEQEESKRQC